MGNEKLIILMCNASTTRLLNFIIIIYKWAKIESGS